MIFRNPKLIKFQMDLGPGQILLSLSDILLIHKNKANKQYGMRHLFLLFGKYQNYAAQSVILNSEEMSRYHSEFLKPDKWILLDTRFQTHRLFILSYAFCFSTFFFFFLLTHFIYHFFFRVLPLAVRARTNVFCIHCQKINGNINHHLYVIEIFFVFHIFRAS